MLAEANGKGKIEAMPDNETPMRNALGEFLREVNDREADFSSKAYRWLRALDWIFKPLLSLTILAAALNGILLKTGKKEWQDALQ